MRIVTYNINGIGARLPNLLRWLDESKPDVVCLQELKAPQDKFPEAEIRNAGYHVIWHGQKSWNGVAILSRGLEIREIARVLPGDPEDLHSRYIEAEINNIHIACLYLPNGNPAPGPKFDYKLQWFERLKERAAEIEKMNIPAILIGDFNVIRSWSVLPGRMLFAHFIVIKSYIPSGIIFAMLMAGMPVCASTIFY
jgi:exodeoxyribonuclease-3